MEVEITGNIRIINPHLALKRAVMAANTFDNPAWKNAVAQNRSTRFISRKIKTYQCDSLCDMTVLTVPRGYLRDLLKICSPTIADKRSSSYADVPAMGGITLRDYQSEALGSVLQHEQGVLQMPTGAGKTVTGLELIHKQKQKALILVHSKVLAKQWKGEIEKHMSITPGMIGGGKWKVGETITIAMIQTLARNPEKTVRLGLAHGLVLVDECHHIPAQTFAKVMGKLPCKYRYGLTATPYRSDGLNVLIHRVVGDVVAQVAREDVEQAGSIVKARVEVRETGLYPGRSVDDWPKYMAWITHHAGRNLEIAAAAIDASMDKGQVLILTDRVNQAIEVYGHIMEELPQHKSDYKKLTVLTGTSQKQIRQTVLAHGQLPVNELREAMDQAQHADITVGTSGLLGEGLDVSGWSVLVLASPMSGRVRLLQAIGRVIRPAPDKEEGLIIDFVDQHGFSRGSFNKRMAIYNDAKYRVHHPAADKRRVA